MKEMSSATVIFACMKSCTVSGRPLRRRLAREAGRLEEAAQRRHLPARVPVQLPLVEDAVDLRVVDDAGDVDLPVRADLGERAEDRARAEHRRGDPDPPLRLADPLRDPVRERLAVLGREPRPHLDRRRRRPAAARRAAEPITSPVSQSWSKLSPYACASVGRLDDRDHVLLARPRVLRPVHRAGPDRRRGRGSTYLWCIRSGTPGIGARRDRQRLEQLRCGLRRRRHRDRPGVVDVVDEPDGDAALLRVDAARR